MKKTKLFLETVLLKSKCFWLDHVIHGSICVSCFVPLTEVLESGNSPHPVSSSGAKRRLIYFFPPRLVRGVVAIEDDEGGRKSKKEMSRGC